MYRLLTPLLLFVFMSDHGHGAETFTLGVVDRMAYVPAHVAHELGFWSNLGININVLSVADEDDLFHKVRQNFQRTGRRATDFGVCRIDELAFERAKGLKVDAIAQVAMDIGNARIVTNTPWQDLDLPDNLRHVLFVKHRLKQDNPGLIEKFSKGYQRAQDWIRDPDNAQALTDLVAKKFYWVNYKSDPAPLGIEFVQDKLKQYTLLESIALNDSYIQHWQNVYPHIAARVINIHNGVHQLEQTTPEIPPSGTNTAFDDALAWWRFSRSHDFSNSGTAGAALNLTAMGSETNLRLYGVQENDYYHRERIWEFGGFGNDGFGWASDGIRKYAATDPKKDDLLDTDGDFSVWLRCSNRNTRNTVLVGKGTSNSNSGFSVSYQRGEPPQGFSFAIHAATEQTLQLKGIPLHTFLDVCFCYEASTETLRGWAHNTTTGERVSHGSTRIDAGCFTSSPAPLTIGGNFEHDTNMPLHGNIESVAIWHRVLTDSEVRALSTGPKPQLRETATIPTSRDFPLESWHNVRDYGAIGDGKHDDTDAIQAAIDACIVKVTMKDPKSGRWINLPDNPPRPGFGYGGGVFIPSGFYRTTRPIVLRPNVTIIGDQARNPFIASEADAALVWWAGSWLDRAIDFKVRNGVRRRCTNVTLKNIQVRGKRFGAHTMGVDANRMLIHNCRFEGVEAGFVNTGFMMFSQIRDAKFHPSLWILTRQGTRFNTSTIENIVVGLHGTPFDDWAMRLEGCIQCVRLSEITFEVRSRGLFLDSYAAGVTIDIHNLWNYDTGRHSNRTPEVLRIINGRGIRVSNVMALDYPATLFIGKEVRSIELSNVLAKQVVVEDPAATRPVFTNVPAIKVNTDGSMIEGEGGIPKDIRKQP